MERNGMEWNGKEWKGMEWNGKVTNLEAPPSEYTLIKNERLRNKAGLCELHIRIPALSLVSNPSLARQREYSMQP
jgi:hypothetical protein